METAEPLANALSMMPSIITDAAATVTAIKNVPSSATVLVLSRQRLTHLRCGPSGA